MNRLVDAKPEEMRVYIEEAAGVSRYQARRRETLQHLEHTTQNLERLEDIASELKSQLKTLKRQSETAVQYKELETQIRTIKIEVLSFQCEQSMRLQQEYTLQMNELWETFKLVRSELNTLDMTYLPPVLYFNGLFNSPRHYKVNGNRRKETV